MDVAVALLVPGGGTTHVRLLAKAATLLMDESFKSPLRSGNDAAAIAAAVNAELEA